MCILTSKFQFAENTMELGTGHTANVHSVVVFKKRQNLNPPDTHLCVCVGGGGGQGIEVQ